MKLVLVLALIIGFMVADAILDWVFIIVYALLGMAAINDFTHLFKYRREYNRINASDVGRICLYFVIAAVVIVLQVTFL